MTMQASLFPVISDRRLPTNSTTKKYPIHRWLNFVAGYSPEFVDRIIREQALSPNSMLVDPFSGLSTSLVQANFNGIQSVGFETNPYFYDVSKAKIFPLENIADLDYLDSFYKNLKPFPGDFSDVWSPSAVQFLTKLVPGDNLRFLASALLMETSVQEYLRPTYRLIISRVLEGCSGSKIDGIYKAPTSIKKYFDFKVMCDLIIDVIKKDMTYTHGIYARKSQIFCDSSESMYMLEKNSCDICVTSPPYLNNFDFAEMTRMELYFWRYATSWAEITDKVRRRLIVNTTTAPTDIKKMQVHFRNTLSVDLATKLDSLVELLEIKKSERSGGKDYNNLIYPYFSQMQSVIRELERVIKRNGRAHIVVSDAALYGVHIETEKLLGDILTESGFLIDDIKRLRDRGGRWILEKRQGIEKPLGEFHIIAKRRS